MYDPWILSLLQTCAPTAKILILLRDPWDRFISGLSHERRVFARELRGRRERDLDLMIKRPMRSDGVSIQTRSGGSCAFVDRSRLLILQYERCASEPEAELERTLEFLGLDPVRIEIERGGAPVHEGQPQLPAAITDDPVECWQPMSSGWWRWRPRSTRSFGPRLDRGQNQDGYKHASSLLGPDFFIVGAPKCGTSSMAAYLGQHPEIGMCPRKESHVFATDLAERMSMRRKDAPMSKERFLELFSDLQEERVRGEASVWHLYSTAAPAEIMALQPGGPDYRDAPQPGRDAAIVTFPVRLCGYRARGRIRRGARSRREERERSGTPRGFPPPARTAPRSATPSRCDATSMSSGASVCM